MLSINDTISTTALLQGSRAMFLIPHGTEVDCPPQGMEWYRRFFFFGGGTSGDEKVYLKYSNTGRQVNSAHRKEAVF